MPLVSPPLLGPRRRGSVRTYTPSYFLDGLRSLDHHPRSGARMALQSFRCILGHIVPRTPARESVEASWTPQKITQGGLQSDGLERAVSHSGFVATIPRGTGIQEEARNGHQKGEPPISSSVKRGFSFVASSFRFLWCSVFLPSGEKRSFFLCLFYFFLYLLL